MVTKNQFKFINSLKQKKSREEYNLFIAEGAKIVPELLQSNIKIKQVFATSEFFKKNKLDTSIERFEVKIGELERLSLQMTPNEVLAVCEIPKYEFNRNKLNDKLTLILDDIKDPGNLGTIIRIADWFGIETIICSNETVDAFNPKVVQSTMGSIARIELHYMDLVSLFGELKEISSEGSSLPIYGALLDGNNIYQSKLSANGCIVIGNESKGISNSILPFITDKINIPSFSHFKSGGGEAESLNAAIATSIICSEFRRR
ncbi:MAG: RNA methyltransferase [Bacteroidota bacterium]